LSNLLYAVLAVVVVSLLSLVGVLALSLKKDTLENILFILLSFSAGSILGAAYLDLLPEAVEFFGEEQLSIVVFYVTLGFLTFFFLERFIYWYHGHGHTDHPGVDEKCRENPVMTVKDFVYLNLIGDGIHNLIDGMIIAAGFFISIPVGLAATVAVAFHELPQEIGDFGVLVYGGFTRHKALLFNFLSALTAIVGVVASSYFSAHIENFVGYLIALAAGGFTYLAASELIPEIQQEKNVVKSMIQFALFLLGIALIWSLGFLFPE
jgi:zinc and cadmium transporter